MAGSSEGLSCTADSHLLNIRSQKGWQWLNVVLYEPADHIQWDNSTQFLVSYDGQETNKKKRIKKGKEPFLGLYDDQYPNLNEFLGIVPN